MWDFVSTVKMSCFFLCFFLGGGYIFRDLLTFYSLIVRFCYIFSWTFYCGGSVYPSVRCGGGGSGDGSGGGSGGGGGGKTL